MIRPYGAPFSHNLQHESLRPSLPLFISVSQWRAHTLGPQTHSGKRWLITLRAPHWDVRNNYLCLAATQDPSGEVIILTRGCSLQSQLIHINSGARATITVWMHGCNYTRYRTRQAPQSSVHILILQWKCPVYTVKIIKSPVFKVTEWSFDKKNIQNTGRKATGN